MPRYAVILTLIIEALTADDAEAVALSCLDEDIRAESVSAELLDPPSDPT